jgi:hypothetical protein
VKGPPFFPVLTKLEGSEQKIILLFCYCYTYDDDVEQELFVRKASIFDSCNSGLCYTNEPTARELVQPYFAECVCGNSRKIAGVVERLHEKPKRARPPLKVNH